MLDNYQIDEFGVLHQMIWKPKLYDKQYLSYYEGLQERTIKLGYQRLGWVLGLLRRLPNSVLEIGYGTGTFLEAAQIAGVPVCSGYDVARYPLPPSCNFVEWEDLQTHQWDLVVLFDVLEHIPDLSFLSFIHAKTIAVTVPYCLWSELGDEWFRDWRMRLPDEHLHHFDTTSLKKLMEHHGYHCIEMNSYEDGLRLRQGEVGPNIISGFFENRRIE